MRRYHREYYRASNMCLIVAGKMSTAQLLDAIVPFEESLLQQQQ